MVHGGYRANLLPGVPPRHGAAEGEVTALLLLPHDHRLRLQRVKGPFRRDGRAGAYMCIY